MTSTVELRLGPLPRVTRALLAGVLISGYLAVASAAVIVHQQYPALAAWYLWATAVLLFAGALWVGQRRRSDDRRVAVEADRLLAPLASGLGRRERAIPHTRIRSIEFSPSGRHGAQLRLNVAGRFPLVIRGRDIACGNLSAFVQGLRRAALAANPDLSRAEALWQRRKRLPAAAIAVAGVLALVYWRTPEPDLLRSYWLLANGALNPGLVAAGEYHRLGAAALLHASPGHLLVNVALLVIIGLRLEYVTGPTRFAGAVVAGMLAGNVAAALLTTAAVVVGSSGGVFGVLGLYAHTVVKRRAHLPTLTQFGPGWFLLLALTVAFLPLPGIELSAHFGGFLGGLAWGAIAARPARVVPLALVAAAAWLVVLGSGWWAVRNADRWLATADRVMQRLAEAPRPRVVTLELVGWHALHYGDAEQRALSAGRMRNRNDLSAGARTVLAELLLDQGDAQAAAHLAQSAGARDVQIRAELHAFSELCEPQVYGSATPPPLAEMAGDGLRFTANRPLYVHAIVNRDYVMMPTAVTLRPVAAQLSDVVVTGYSDRVPWWRAPVVHRLHQIQEPLCNAARQRP